MERGRRARCVLVWLAAATGCGGERAAEPLPPGGGEQVRVDAVGGAGAANAEAEARARALGGAPLDEASARLLVAARFRAAGLRVLEDVPLRADDLDLTLDGFDPARRVGYEYVAADERGADLDDGERARLAGLDGARVLLLDSGSAEAIAGAVDRFLAGLGPEPSATDGNASR